MADEKLIIGGAVATGAAGAGYIALRRAMAERRRIASPHAYRVKPGQPANVAAILQDMNSASQGKFERFVAQGKGGKVLSVVDGEKTRIASPRVPTAAKRVIHNHPSFDAINRGGGFSPDDIAFAIEKSGRRPFHVATDTGSIYSMRAGRNAPSTPSAVDGLARRAQQLTRSIRDEVRASGASAYEARIAGRSGAARVLAKEGAISYRETLSGDERAAVQKHRSAIDRAVSSRSAKPSGGSQVSQGISNLVRSMFGTRNVGSPLDAKKTRPRAIFEMSVHGGRGWVAAIKGRDKKFGYAREFVPSRDVTGSGNVYRQKQFALDDGLYEISEQASARRNQRSFALVRGGKLKAISADRAERRLAAMERLTKANASSPSPSSGSTQVAQIDLVDEVRKAEAKGAEGMAQKQSRKAALEGQMSGVTNRTSSAGAKAIARGGIEQIERRLNKLGSRGRADLGGQFMGGDVRKWSEMSPRQQAEVIAKAGKASTAARMSDIGRGVGAVTKAGTKSKAKPSSVADLKSQAKALGISLAGAKSKAQIQERLARGKVGVISESKYGKGPSGWSDEARAASAEARARKSQLMGRLDRSLGNDKAFSSALLELKSLKGADFDDVAKTVLKTPYKNRSQAIARLNTLHKTTRRMAHKTASLSGMGFATEDDVLKAKALVAGNDSQPAKAAKPRKAAAAPKLPTSAVAEAYIKQLRSIDPQDPAAASKVISAMKADKAANKAVVLAVQKEIATGLPLDKTKKGALGTIERKFVQRAYDANAMKQAKTTPWSILGPAAIAGAAAVAFDATRSQAMAAGSGKTAATAKGIGAATAAGGTVAAIGYGIGKAAQFAARNSVIAGKVVGRALPAVAVAMAAYEAGKGAVTGYEKDGVIGAMKGAATGVADFATFGAYSHFTTPKTPSRLDTSQKQRFSAENAKYAEEQKTKKKSTRENPGWSDQARINAAITRGAVMLPYGGSPREGIGVTPQAAMASTKR